MPTVTVLLPAGSDVAATLLTIRDLRAQSFSDFDVLVLDDGTAPLMRPMLDQECGGGGVQVIRVEKGSAGAALNEGLDAAQGELVARIAAGDVSAPDRFDRQVSLLATAPEVAFVLTGWRSIQADGDVHRQVAPPAADAGLRLALATGDAIGHPTAMMRRDAVRKAGGWRPAFVGVEDYDLLLRLLDRHRGASVPDALVECKPPSEVLGWRVLEQLILSEMAAVAAHDRRQVGRPDHGERTTPVDRSVLHRMGMAEEEIARSITGHALSAAMAAGVAGQWRAMREAAQLGLRQEDAPAGSKSQFAGLWLRSVARRRPGGAAGRLDAAGDMPGLSADRG